MLHNFSVSVIIVSSLVRKHCGKQCERSLLILFLSFSAQICLLNTEISQAKLKSDSSTRTKEKAEEPDNSLTSQFYPENDLAVPVVLERIQKGNMRRNKAVPLLLLNEKKGLEVFECIHAMILVDNKSHCYAGRSSMTLQFCLLKKNAN